LTHQKLFPWLALLWLILLLPDLGAHYSFGWDSSQFDRAVTEFDIARHQPHPPGYPLWIVALRGLTPLAGNPNRAQVVLALLFSMAALWFFRDLARDLMGDRAGLSATVLLAFSPVVCLNASSSQVYAVDLFASCFAAWLTKELWSGRTQLVAPGLAVVALAAGFRPSNLAFLLPLLCLGVWQCFRRKPAHAAGGVLIGVICWLGWLVPTALVTGGLRTLAALNDAQMSSSFQKSSVFFGAPPIVHARMTVEVSIYFAVALSGFALPVAWRLRTRLIGGAEAHAGTHPVWATPAFFLLWLAPNLALLYLFHCSQPGYLMLSLPPLALLLAWLARSALGNGLGWTTAGLATALLAGYFPYERLVNPTVNTLPFVLLRATPRISRIIEQSQNDIRKLIDALPGQAGEKLVFCFCRRFEAPNIRTVTYDFSDVAWADPGGRETRVFHSKGSPQPLQEPFPFRSVAWVCAGTEPPESLRAQYPQVRRIAGNNLYSFWTSSPGAAR